MTISGIKTNFIDLTAVSGSDNFKTAMGSFVDVVTSPIDNSQYFDYHNYSGGELPASGISSIEANTDLLEEVNFLSLFNSYRMPCRIYEDLDFEFDNHLWWEAYVMGGMFLENTYPGVLNTEGIVYGDHCITDILLPYSNYDSNVIDFANQQSKGLYKTSITANYKKDYEEYIDFTNGMSDIRLIPNAYLFQTIKENPDKTDHYAQLWEFVSIQDVYPDIIPIEPANLLDSVLISGYLPPASSTDAGTIGYQGDEATFGTGYADNQFEDLDVHLRTYFSSSFPTRHMHYSSSTTAATSQLMRNILFDQDAVTQEAVTIAENIAKFPFYITINFQSLDAVYNAAKGDEAEYKNYVKDLISSNNLDSKFIKDIREVFGVNKTIETTINQMVRPISFQTEKNHLTASQTIEGHIEKELNEVSSTALRTVDFAEFVNFAYLNNRCDQQVAATSYLVGPRNMKRQAATSPGSLYIHYNAINVANFVKDFQELSVNELAQDLDKAAYGSEDLLDSVLRLSTHASAEFSWSDFSTWTASGNKKYTETLAYRIEKTTAQASPGGAAQEPIQNFWICEGMENNDITLYDTQIKYDQDYTYNIYAYVLVCGNKYSIDDVRLGKPSGIVGEEAPDYEGWHCIQWDQPGNATNYISQLFEADEDNALLGITTFADNSQSISKTYRYMADFYLNFEASAKIIEIPIATKKLKVLDNPPNMIDVNPFQIMDNSQTIGFSIRYDNFIKSYNYPKQVLLSDYHISSAYLHSLDLLNSENEVDNYINRESVSKQSQIQVFRMDRKPKHIVDFENNSYAVLDLSMENSKNSLSHTIFYDKITTNEKYYYLFRTLNKRGIPGYISEIYEAELVDDGGFKFSIFDALFEEELDERDKFYTAPSKSFKKLFMLQPNINQMALDISSTNFENPSYEEANTIDVGHEALQETIWNKTFKLRLTSKKTGKKMDLNITYKIIE